MLIGSLYVVSGGIHISVKGEATPAMNTLFLVIGGIASNVLGTTGASTLLILSVAAHERFPNSAASHSLFRIFIVSNGGCLTLNCGYDPPLLVGFLKGVPFWWVLEHCWVMWLVSMAFLMAVFYCIDLRDFRQTPKAVRQELAETEHRWRFSGLWNAAFLAVIIAAVFFPGPLVLGQTVMLAAKSVACVFYHRQGGPARRQPFPVFAPSWKWRFCFSESCHDEVDA